MCEEEEVLPCDICGKPSVVEIAQIVDITLPGDKSKRYKTSGYFSYRCLEHPDTTPQIIMQDPETPPTV